MAYDPRQLTPAACIFLLLFAAPAYAGFCTGKQNGLWCDGSKLVNCSNGNVTSSKTCTSGCQSMPAGVADKCKAAANFCTGKQNGLWCDGDKLVNCKNNAVSSSKKCASGCQSMPAGVADKCKAAANFCTGKQNGAWCDGNKLVNCQGDAVASSQPCPNGCQSNPAGVADACKGGGGGFCQGKQNGLWCDGKELVNCKDGQVSSSSTCTAGCISMPAGVADKCATPGGEGKLVLCEPFKPKKAVTCGFGCYSGHKGSDYAAANGTPLYAPVAGTIVAQVNSYAGQTCKPDFGNYIKIATGPWEVFMAHMDKDIKVAKGAQVKAGQQVGKVSNTGYTLTMKNGIWVCQQGGGHHLHLEVRKNGVAVNAFSHPDVVWSSDCSGGVPPVTGFCSGKQDGLWCNGSKLVNCKGGAKASEKHCDDGCESMPQGVADQCKAPAPVGFCAGKADGLWCEGGKLLTCKGDQISSSKACDFGCQSNAKGVDDACKPAPPTGFCATHADGPWCDGGKLLTCKDAQLIASEDCKNGCDGAAGSCAPDPNETDACAGKGDGAWCASSLLIFCAGGKVASKTLCAKGCQSTGAGQPGACVEGVGFCGDKTNGWWCSGEVLVQCLVGKEVSSQPCASGCTSQPAPLSDQCSEPSPFCADKADGGWCDEGFLVECAGGKESARVLCGFGCKADDGGATGSCIQLGSGACVDKKSGTTCMGNVLITRDGANVHSSIICLNGCASTADGSAGCIVPWSQPAGSLEVRTGDNCATLKGSFELPVAAQNQRLHDAQLGACGGISIASDGALISALSMVYSWFNLPRQVLGISGNTPPLENAWRNNHDGYQACADGQGQCCARWDRNPETMGFLYYPLAEAGCMDVAAATALVEALNGLQPAVAAVHWGEGPGYRHWVTVVGAADGKLLVHDPWGGAVAVELAAGALGSYVIDALFVPYQGDSDAVQPGTAPVLNGEGEEVAAATIPGGLVMETGEEPQTTPPVVVGGGGRSASSCSAVGPQGGSAAALCLLLLGTALFVRVRRRRI